MRPARLLFPLMLALLAWTQAGAADPAESTAAAQDAIANSTGAVLRGNSREAIDVLTAVPAHEYNPVDAAYRACMLDRFGRPSPPSLTGAIEDPFVQAVLAAYQDYWWRALAHLSQQSALEAALMKKLQAQLGERGQAATDFDALEAVLLAELKVHGHHALAGRTAPLRELMLWRNQTTRSYDVELPEGPQNVRVELLDEFVSLGWGAYGRCERGSTGGWATEEALFAVVPSYKEGLDSELFRVVFLGHEAQHFADKHRFPGLADWELEYRAKLVELTYASTTLSHKRLHGFMTAQGNSPDAPHPYANTRVVAALRERLGVEPDQAPLQQLQAAAREELLADSRRLSARHRPNPSP
jgi:hypothetical protein